LTSAVGDAMLPIMTDARDYRVLQVDVFTEEIGTPPSGRGTSTRGSLARREEATMAPDQRAP
jgi:hypothetical protein